MELYQLRTFKMVAEEGHLTRAAKRLHASQPAVSAHIKNLEEELGIALFQRTPKGMILTAEGLKLKKHADHALEVIHDLAIEAKSLRNSLSGELRVGINSETDSLRVPELFSKMKEQNPDLNLHLLQSNTDETPNKLEEEVLDAGYIYGESLSPLIFTLPLKRLQLVVAGPIGWQDRLASATPEDLGGFPWIMTPSNCYFNTVTSDFFSKHGLAPEKVGVIDQESVIRMMIKAEVGLSLLLEQDVLKEPEQMAMWKGEDLSLQLSVICLDKRKEEPMLQSLFAVLRKIWPENVKET